MQMYICNSKQRAVCKLRCSGVPIESFIRVLLVLFCLALSLLAPGGIMSDPKDYQEKERTRTMPVHEARRGRGVAC